MRYLLEGNVRRVGANLRVAAQLLEAETGAAIWSAKFDRPLAELAELQEELVTDIAASLDTQVYALEMERALKKPSDITAWEAVARAWSAYRRWDGAPRASGIEEAKRAVAIAPDYGQAHAMLAVALGDTYLSESDDPAAFKRIRATAERAIALAPGDIAVLSNVGLALSYIGCPEEGVRYTERAVRIAPGGGMMQLWHGVLCLKLGRLAEALSHLKTAERLCAGSHMMWVVKIYLFYVHGAMRRWDEADAFIGERLSLLPTFGMGHVMQALCCERLEDDGNADGPMRAARRLGWQLAQAERLYRRVQPQSPFLETDIAIIGRLYAATEPGA